MDPTAPAGGRGGRNDVESYMQYGYVPNTIGRSVSTTTEYAHDDFALANLAGVARQHRRSRRADRAQPRLAHAVRSGDRLSARPRHRRCAVDRRRSTSSRGPTTTPRPTRGSRCGWRASTIPTASSTIFGGNDAAVAKLTEFFTQAKNDWETSDPSAANFPRKWYWAGNEPDLNAPFLFAQLGRPDLTDQWVRWIEDTIYTDQPDGVPGNDDGGAMGSWYVLATLGLFPVAGSDKWLVGAPRFPQARVNVGGHELLIIRQGTGTTVQSVTLDGADVSAGMTQAQLVGGSKLLFVMN